MKRRFVSRIRKLAIRLGHRPLAEALGVERHLIRNWLYRNKPRIETINRLSDKVDRLWKKYCAPLDGATSRCVECGCLPPGHKIDCVSSNERARKYQRELAQRYANRRRRKGNHPVTGLPRNAELSEQPPQNL